MSNTDELGNLGIPLQPRIRYIHYCGIGISNWFFLSFEFRSVSRRVLGRVPDTILHSIKVYQL